MGQAVRSFMVDCWAGGVWMATGQTRDLPDVAGVAHSWLQAPRVRDLVTQWPFLRTWALAEAHERGEAIPVRWRELRERAARDPRLGLRELVEAAHEQPRLRALSPGTSMWWLTFSRWAAPPVSYDLPRSVRKSGRELITGPVRLCLERGQHRSRGHHVGIVGLVREEVIVRRVERAPLRARRQVCHDGRRHRDTHLKAAGRHHGR